MSGVREPRQSERIQFIFQFPLLSPSLPLTGSGARGTASLSGISCQGSSRESGCTDPGDASAPRREKLIHNSFVFPNPFGLPRRVFGRQFGGRGAAEEPGLGDSSRLGGARGNCKFVGSRGSASCSRPKLRHSARGWSRAPGWAVPTAPRSQVPRPRGTGARLTERAAGGRDAGRDYCRAPLVLRINSVRRCLRGALLSGLLELSARRRRTRGGWPP